MELASKARNISDVSEEIKTVLKELSSLCPDVRVMLFGSFSQGTASDSSDLDLAVILPDAVDLKIFKKDFYKTRTRIQIPVDFIFRNQSQFANLGSDNPVDDEIRQNGIELFPRWNLRGEI